MIGQKKLTAIRLHHYIMSDLHLGHDRILEFTSRKFDSIKEHDDFIIDQICALHAHEVLHLLGDIAWNTESLLRLEKAKCTIHIYLGNHDKFSTETYLKVCKSVNSMREMTYNNKRYVFSHVPFHPSQLDRWDKNFHGHLHDDVIKDDKRYINVCCEKVDCVPIKISRLLWNTLYFDRH